MTSGKSLCRSVRKLASDTAPTPPFGLSSLGKSGDWAMRRMVQAAPGVTLRMPEATSALRSAHMRFLDFDIMLPLPGVRRNLRLPCLASGRSA